MGTTFRADVVTVDDDDVVSVGDRTLGFSTSGSDATTMAIALEHAVGDLPISWLADPFGSEYGDIDEATDDDCYEPGRIVETLDWIEQDCTAHPQKYPARFLEEYRELIAGLRRVCQTARERDALVLTSLHL
jgi:hypothetical protein